MEGHLDGRSRGLQRLLPLYVVCYTLWLGFCALSMWTVLRFRDVLLLLLPVVGPWAMGAVDKFGLLIFGLIALIWIFYIEDYLRSGVEIGKLWQRLGRVTVVHALALALAYALQFLIVLWL